MAVVEQVRETIRKEESDLQGQQAYIGLKDFYFDMLNKGLVLEPEYNLPLVDTVGRTLYGVRDVESKK